MHLAGRLRLAAALALAVLLPACHQTNRDLEANLPFIDGIALLKYDSVRLRIEHDPGSGKLLLFHGRPVSNASLRVGDTFLIGDGGEQSTGYRVLAINDKLITLEKRTVRDRSAQREGIHRSATLIRVAPYGAEN